MVTLEIQWLFDFQTKASVSDFRNAINKVIQNPESVGISPDYFNEDEIDFLVLLSECIKKSKVSFFSIDGLNDTAMFLTIVDKLKNRPRPAGFGKRCFGKAGEDAIDGIYDCVKQFLIRQA